MAERPAFTCCTAWFPVTAPSACTYDCPCKRVHRRSAPRRASECSTCTEPRRRSTSSAVYGRVTPSQRGSDFHCISSFERPFTPFPLPPLPLCPFPLAFPLVAMLLPLGFYSPAVRPAVNPLKVVQNQ